MKIPYESNGQHMCLKIKRLTLLGGTNHKDAILAGHARGMRNNTRSRRPGKHDRDLPSVDIEIFLIGMLIKPLHRLRSLRSRKKTYFSEECNDNGPVGEFSASQGSQRFLSWFRLVVLNVDLAHASIQPRTTWFWYFEFKNLAVFLAFLSNVLTDFYIGCVSR